MYPFSNDDSTDFQIVPDRFLKLKSEIFLQHVVQTNLSGSFYLWQFTGKSLSEALIFASTNPQYDDRLFIVHEN